MNKRTPMFDQVWIGCTITYAAGISWVYTDGLDIGWRFLIAVVIFAIGDAVVRAAKR